MAQPTARVHAGAAHQLSLEELKQLCLTLPLTPLHPSELSTAALRLRAAESEDRLGESCWWSDTWPEPRALLQCEGEAYVALFAADKQAARRLCEAIDFTEQVTVAGAGMGLLGPLRLRTNVKAKLKFWMMSADDEAAPEEEDPGVDVLREEDAALVTAHWEHSDEQSYVLQRIKLGPSACLRDAQGVPMAWGLTHSEGAIGAVHTLEEHRRQGLGRRVVLALRARIAARGLLGYCYVGDKNEASRALFEAAGFQRLEGAVFWVLCHGAVAESEEDED